MTTLYCSRTRSLNPAISILALAYNKRRMTATVRARSVHVPEESAAGPNARRLLAVDYGRKRIGLALSDELGLTAQPLTTITRSNRRDDLRRLREICREHGVTNILVGKPIHLSGEDSEMSAEAARFAARLEKLLGIPVELVDERLTSWEAEQAVLARKPSSSRRQQPLDAIAAAILLRDYLRRARESSRLALTERS